MDNKAAVPYLLEFPLEKKILFYNTYVPEFISTFKDYLSELQLCVDYNYYKNLGLDEKVNNIIDFYTKLGNNNLKIDKIQISNNNVQKAGTKTLDTETVIYWVNKFSTLCKSIQDSINDNLKAPIKFNEFSNSIGVLSYIRNSLTDNVVPYWDVFNKCFIPIPAIGSGVYMKMTKGNMYSMTYMHFKNNVLFRNNMNVMLDSEEVEKDKTLVKAESGLNTTAHQQDLVTDTPSYFRLYNMLSTLNGVLSVTLQQFYSVIKDMQYGYPYVARDYGELENTTFITLDNEGKNMKKDLYQNKIES